MPLKFRSSPCRQAINEALEKAAKVADLYAETNIEAVSDSVLHDPVLSGAPMTTKNMEIAERLSIDGCVHSAMYHAATNIAAAIRALKTTS